MTVSEWWSILSLHPDQVATIIPTRVYDGGKVSDPTDTLFMWRTASLSKAPGCGLGFSARFKRCGGLLSALRRCSYGMAATAKEDPGRRTQRKESQHDTSTP
jgi:hypothetical protein